MLTIGNYNFVEAHSDPLKTATYRLRYQVYAEEFGFERRENHPQGFETDEFDQYSMHFAALNDKNDLIGTVRLVMDSELGLPIERAVSDIRAGISKVRSKFSGAAEISRLAVSKQCRRRMEDGLFGMESCLIRGSDPGSQKDACSAACRAEEAKRPVIAFGLYRLIYKTIKKHNVTSIFCIIDRKLFWTLRRYSFMLHQVGDPVDYHGLRIPCMGIVDEMERVLDQEKPVLMQLMVNNCRNEVRAGAHTI